MPACGAKKKSLVGLSPDDVGLVLLDQLLHFRNHLFQNKFSETKGPNKLACFLRIFLANYNTLRVTLERIITMDHL
jgi:hypothetical protein